MPRLTTRHYFRVNHQLRRFWLHIQAPHGELASLEQWQLHDYLQPSEDLTDDELLARRRITHERPKLPHQAGRALRKFQAGAAWLGLTSPARQGTRSSWWSSPAE